MTSICKSPQAAIGASETQPKCRGTIKRDLLGLITAEIFVKVASKREKSAMIAVSILESFVLAPYQRKASPQCQSSTMTGWSGHWKTRMTRRILDVTEKILQFA